MNPTAASQSAQPAPLLFPVRRIAFAGRSVAVVLQGANGPCPLLALANALLLIGAAELPARYAGVREAWLVDTVWKHVSARHAAADANMAALLADVQRLLPTLVRGLDLNLRFAAADAFVFTPQLSVFDLAGLRVVHGFVVDGAEEPDAAEALCHALCDHVLPSGAVACSAAESAL